MSKTEKEWISFSDNPPTPETGKLYEVKLKDGTLMRGHFMDYGFQTNGYVVNIDLSPWEDVTYREINEIQPNHFVKDPDLSELKETVSKYTEDIQLGYPVKKKDKEKVLNTLLKTLYGQDQQELINSKMKRK